MLANNGLGGYGSYDRKGFELGVKIAMSRNLPITIAGPKNNENWFKENSWIFGYPKLTILEEPSNEILRQLYTSHTIFLHPSELEAGHPNLTILEAAACGLPILGWIELDTIFHGLWRAPRDLQELLRGLDTIVNEYDDYRGRSLQTAQELSWLNRAKELIDLYERHTN
jgi:glycosyltransferase involved in cell wall biosynthesis